MKKDACMYCGEKMVEGTMCECKERERAIDRCIKIADSMQFSEIEGNLSLGFHDVIKIRDAAKGERIEMAWLAYKVGVLVGADYNRWIKEV